MERFDNTLPVQQEDAIDLRHYWRVLMRFKWGILGLAIAVTLALFFLFQQCGLFIKHPLHC